MSALGSSNIPSSHHEATPSSSDRSHNNNTSSLLGKRPTAITHSEISGQHHKKQRHAAVPTETSPIHLNDNADNTAEPLRNDIVAGYLDSFSDCNLESADVRVAGQVNHRKSLPSRQQLCTHSSLIADVRTGLGGHVALSRRYQCGWRHSGWFCMLTFWYRVIIEGRMLGYNGGWPNNADGTWPKSGIPFDEQQCTAKGLLISGCVSMPKECMMCGREFSMCFAGP